MRLKPKLPICFRAALGAAALFAAACAEPESSDPETDLDPADRIFVGLVYTGVPAAPQAEAVAVRDGRIAAVGAREDVAALAGPETNVVELGPAVLYPGFTDAHVHILGVGLRETTLNLEGTPSIVALQDVVRARIEQGGSNAPV